MFYFFFYTFLFGEQVTIFVILLQSQNKEKVVLG